MQQKAARGEYTGGRAKFGYRVAGDGKKLEPDESEQAALVLARPLRAERRSLREVARALEAGGWRSRTWMTLSPVQIARMVGEATY